MRREGQLIWGIVTIVAIVVILLWLLRNLRSLLLWLRFNLIPGIVLLGMVLGILYLGVVIFWGKEES